MMKHIYLFIYLILISYNEILGSTENTRMGAQCIPLNICDHTSKKAIMYRHSDFTLKLASMHVIYILFLFIVDIGSRLKVAASKLPRRNYVYFLTQES
jgi:hypothetical protein